MTTHAIVSATVTDPAAMEAYRARAGEALAKYGAAPVQVSNELTLLEGDGELPQFMVVLAFPDRDSALAWRNDPELAETHALRQKGAKTTITLL